MQKEGIKNQLGVVVIGRNEGDRLRVCLDSAIQFCEFVVYVDSGSTDDSVNLAFKLGVEVVELDISIPFTAARARNAGFAQLIKLNPNLKYVQFVDGDCEIVPDWLAFVFDFLEKNKNVAVVCGRRRERYPEATVYNMLCDIEWDTPIGETKACGGDAMFRIDAFQEVNGFRDNSIAGEEPELCVRLRQEGHKIWRLDHEMTLHDAAMSKLSQWWKRSVRAGYAFAEGSFLHGEPPEYHWVTESRRSVLWGGVIPGFILLMLFFFGYKFLFLILIYPIQVIRLAFRGKRSTKENWLQAFFLVLGKFPEFIGLLKFQIRRIFHKEAILIEYK